jgi:hypothetical protein
VGSIGKGNLEPFRREVKPVLLLSWQRAVVRWWRVQRIVTDARVENSIVTSVSAASLLQDSRPPSRIQEFNCGIRVQRSKKECAQAMQWLDAR